MLIKEYRVVLPITVEEYQVGQLYSVAEVSKNETGGGEGVEVRKNEPFTDYPLLGGKYSSGQYTYKIYHLGSRVPGYIRLLAPKGSLEVHEEAWNAYPYCKTVITNPGYMKDAFFISIETMHCPDRGEKENAHELSPEKLRMREIEYIDIGNDTVAAKDYNELADPSKFKSEKTGRGPLTGDWRETVDPVMCAYKLVTVEFKWLGLQTKVESFIQSTEQRLFLKFHREVFCWMDQWHGLTMADIRRMEDETKNKLKEIIAEGDVRGTLPEE